MSYLNQKTIKNTISFSGIGLHTGVDVKVSIKPATPDTGIIFKRVDLNNNNIVYPNFNTAITKLIDNGWPFENFKLIKKHIAKSLKNRTIISLLSNSFGLNEKASSLEIIDHNYENGTVNLKVDSVDKVSDKVSIADAQIVVSGGRGLKGPENWHLIEDLAEVLGAATACSKPVSDMGWRPHSEHVGQTGKPVASNLYIAVGVSGAIQHLAGINSSKIKVVINSDPEAPFFKAADYGIVGDAFEVIPKLTQKLKMRK